jgi:hypothetical protein
MLIVALSLAAVWALVLLGALALCVAAGRSDAARAAERRRPSRTAAGRRFAPTR